ncbi:hypothetical protein GQF01_07160 [Paenibacillus sp. 5J-6]|uniref:Type II toxin-antitoxin system PemK/MazF family toxin n=1 Tax=Paenibacillus silvestris TaxID=2606219 RepID=A0A6L8UX05_9BACL|nr:hypothetical protein [Paenibacillus silvestris]
MGLNEDIVALKEEVAKILDGFNNKMLKEITKPEIYLNHLKQRINFLNWTSRKYNLLSVGDPETVLQRDVFYCEFGFNVGSEQQENRPAVILQNDRGNASSRTTVIAPVSTHNHCAFFEDRGKKYIKFTNDIGEEITKKLDYYEILIILEEEFGERVKGYINVAQIKTISKKRLSRVPVGRITTGNFEVVKRAINRLI